MKSKVCNIFCNRAYEIFLFIGIHQDGSFTYQTEIAREKKMVISTVNYHITKFKQEGLINKQIKLTDKGIKLFKYLWENMDKKELRAHNIQIKFEVIKCPSNFPDCFSRSVYQPLSNKRYRGIKTVLGRFTCMFYSPKKIVCVLPDIYANNDEEISSQIQLLTPNLILILEEEFNGIKLGDYELARIQTMHVAVLDSIIAKNYLIKGFTKENKDYAIDNSNGISEVELTNPKNALRDIMDLLDLDNKLQKNKVEDKDD